MFSTFAGLLIAALLENKSALGFWAIVTAGEIAAWRVKWEVLFASIIVLWSGARIIRSISQNPARFIGLLPAQIGFGGALAVAVLVAALIGITVPERLRQRQYSIEAAMYARGHTLHRAFLEYRDLHGTFPPDRDKYVEALRTLPDPDGSIAEALRFVDPNGYSATATLAAASTKTKSLVVRGVALRYANTPANPEPASAMSFTSYKLRLPSEHRFLADDVQPERARVEALRCIQVADIDAKLANRRRHSRTPSLSTATGSLSTTLMQPLQSAGKKAKHI